LIYEEGNLIKRSIRDLYSKEIDEVLVAGDGAYREAKDFMRLIMPSHAKNVHHYKDQEPLFMRHQVERQLNAMFNPQVKLKSGGYIVIDQTEALVAVDVNSGKSTKEFSIEETALKTNLEAAKEVARQLRLRDLAGLIVIDFIDMDERKNNSAVEHMMKNSLKNDRARIQVGHISAFGLLEMSRQRLRTGVLEGSTSECAHCLGTGIVRSTESVALYVLRSVEDALLTGQPQNITVNTMTESALYILNYKRAYLKEIERHYGITVTIIGNSTLHGVDMTVEKGGDGLPTAAGSDSKVVSIDWAYQGDEQQDNKNTEHRDDDKAKGEEGQRKRTRRPRRRKPRNEEKTPPAKQIAEDKTTTTDAAGDEQTTEKPRRPRRRGRRGGRGRNNSDADNSQKQEADGTEKTALDTDKKPVRKKALPAKPVAKSPAQDAPNLVTDTAASDNRTKPAAKSDPAQEKPAPKVTAKVPEPEKMPTAPKKRGWWQRKTS